MRVILDTSGQIWYNKTIEIWYILDNRGCQVV
nr:MAG TPA: hypothetical protein [Caudoviricetes sp.]